LGPRIGSIEGRKTVSDLIEQLRRERSADVQDAADRLEEQELLIEAQQAEIGKLREALKTLRAHCNKHIQSINQGEGRNTAGFTQINTLLKQCDEAFKALEQKP
jgi:hypothetical protein